MTQREQHRVHVLTRVQHGILCAREAALLLGLSLRHLRRLLARLRQHGLPALAHGNRGRVSPHRLSNAVRTKIITLARTTYAGFNDHHLTEMLLEREGVGVSRQSVQRLLRRLIQLHGLPVAVYSDRHGIFARRRGPLTLTEQLRGAPDLTQVGRALHELGIRWIPASSPQAKGRIERLFQVFQDRLVRELHLAHLTTREDAQRFLPTFLRRYNARFARRPTQPQSAFRPTPPATALDRVCCFKYRRTVAQDNTVRLEERLVQVLPGPGGRSYAKAHVEVHERLNGTLAVFYQGRPLVIRTLTPPPLAAKDLRARRRRAVARRNTRPAPKPHTPQKKRYTLPGSSIPTKDPPWRRMIARDIWIQQHRPNAVTFPLSR